MATRYLSLVAGLFLAGCGAFTTPAGYQELEPGQSYWFRYDASRRGSVMVVGDAPVRYCAEPSPDIALEVNGDGGLSVTTAAGVSADVKARLQSQVIQLAGLNSTIRFLRETLYRVCEARMANAITAVENVQLMRQIIEAAQKLAEAQSSMASAQLTNEITKAAPAGALPAVEALVPAAVAPTPASNSE